MRDSTQHAGYTPPYQPWDGTRTGGVFPAGKINKMRGATAMSSHIRSPPLVLSLPGIQPDAVADTRTFFALTSSYLAHIQISSSVR
nr:MAG TPA: hypothetical protein [Caudoviricetes sp.]DAX08338.1 MAG TPA: hypothetical protein [Bacteriophage sp.]